jgi:NAD-reducing hydrogenase small subunit
MSFLDIDEAIITLSEVIEFGRSPITDIKEFSSADIGIVEGCVGNSEEEETLRHLRANCRILIALGDCACFGALNAMRNVFDKTDVVKRAYIESESTSNGKIPSSPELPVLLEQVKTVSQVVKVDCFIPGCPPDAQTIKFAVSELLAGRLPVIPTELMRFD